MLISSEQIKPSLSPNLQRLVDDVFAKSDGSCQLEFGDAQEYQKILGTPFPPGTCACLTGNDKRFIILINVEQLSSITDKEELEIAHEFGHVWLSLYDFPRERQYNSTDRQKMYDICFGPLFDLMQHAIFYPWLKTNYEIDLYKVGNQRLVSFLRNELPNLRIESEGDQVSLIMNYLKFKIESDDPYWQERLHKAYSKTPFKDLREIAEKALPIIQELISKSTDPQYFVEKYRKVLEAMNIKREIWPDFAQAIS
jgi:hypothetical protein